MIKCELHSYMVPDGPPYYAFGGSRAVTICRTHNWTYGIGEALTIDCRCPIGRIEQAAEDAIDRITKAAQDVP